MRFKQWLAEMPVQSIQHLGDWEPNDNPKSSYLQKRSPSKGYYSDDFGILSNRAAIEKIKQKWSKSAQPFNIFLYRGPLGAKLREIGEVNANFLSETLRLPEETVRQIDNPQSINVVFTNNIGAERMPMNWWTMAHRLGHAIRLLPQYQEYTNLVERRMYHILSDIYGFNRRPSWESPGLYEKGISGVVLNNKMLLSLANGIGGMRSAREGALRNIGEFFHELLAQYIIDGKIRFRPLPNMLVMRYAWGKPQGTYRDRNADMEGWNAEIAEGLAPLANASLDKALNACIGKIFVM